MENWFEFTKDRRFVPVFFITLAAMVSVPLGAAIVTGKTEFGDWLKYWPFIVAVMVAGLLFSIWRSLRRAQARRRDRYKISPLSRDELGKARSKLVKQK